MTPTIDRARLLNCMAEIGWLGDDLAMAANLLPEDAHSILFEKRPTENPHVIERIAKAIGVSVAWLTGLSDERRAPACLTSDLIDEAHRTAAALIVKAGELLAATREALEARRTEGAYLSHGTFSSVHVETVHNADGSGFSVATPRSVRADLSEAAADWCRAAAPNRIAALREAAGLTRRQLGVAVGCGKDTIRRIEEGGRTARLGLYSRLAQALGVASIADLGVVPRFEQETGRPHPVDVAEIVERFGGLEPLAAAVDVTVDEAARWARDGIIPMIRWLDVLNASDRLDLGLSSNGMIGLHQDAVAFGWLDQRWPGPAAADAA